MHGALNQDRGPGKPIAFPSNPQGFADFDRYTLERSRPDIDAFLSWKEEASRHMKERSVVSGDCLRVEVNAFSAEELPWRCPFPHSPIPDETRLYVMRNPRPRLTAVDEILACGKTLDFEVVEVIHHKPDIFSQVFFGVLRALDGRVSPPVCLKLFLDIWFPIKRELLMEYFELEDPSEHLHPVNFPDDMVRREEAAYDRLCEYQGTLIPHCYGFHRFSVEGSFAVYGGLLEIISPPQISHFNFAEASVEKQLGLAKHLRHCLRALLYAGVDQGDYHSGQILVPNGAQYNPERDSLVLIDFAFAIQRLGDEQSPGVVARLLERGELACKYILIGLGITRETLGDLFGLQSLHLNEC
ncbi:hypothetical protein C8F01DRAFT_979073 [Mycena amicta]|nr:hypothetical protein C8F01DRAFT_979073 [Mycena amicta]